MKDAGEPVGRRHVPMGGPTPPLATDLPAQREGGWSSLGIERKTAGDSLPDIIDDLREDRV